MTKRTILTTAMVAATLLAAGSAFNVILSPASAFAQTFAPDSPDGIAQAVAIAIMTLPTDASSDTIQATIKQVLDNSGASPANKQLALAVVQDKALAQGIPLPAIAAAAQTLAVAIATPAAPVVPPSSPQVVNLASQVQTSFVMNTVITGSGPGGGGGGGGGGLSTLGGGGGAIGGSGSSGSGTVGFSSGTRSSPPQGE